MLLQFRFSNFRSFRAEQTLSMVAGSFSDRPETVRHPKGTTEGVLPVAAIYGANASGKTNVILALRFMQAAVTNSHARWEPDKPINIPTFVGDSTPTEFCLDFLIDGTRYQFGFSMSTEAIEEEWLHAYPLGKKQVWFARKRNKGISFSAKLHGDNKTIERLTRVNSLFLSAAAQNNHAMLSPIYSWISRSIDFVVGERTHLNPYQLEVPQAEAISRFLSLADLGITGLQVEKHTDSANFFENPIGTIFKFKHHASLEELNFLEGAKELKFVHQIGNSTHTFSEDQESKGTIAFLSLLHPALSALKDGKVVCIDELDDSLHPLLALELIRLFNDPKPNPKGAQLIFNTHDTNLLSAGVLRRDQIWFTEKKPDGESQLYPLTDFKPRKEENLENGYLQGRYGAIPFLNSDSFLLPSSESHVKKR